MRAIDGGYGWVIVTVSFIYTFVGQGVPTSFGMLVPALMEEFNCTKAAAVNVGSMQYGFCSLVAVAVNWMVEMFGCRNGLFYGELNLFMKCLLDFFVKQQQTSLFNVMAFPLYAGRETILIL